MAFKMIHHLTISLLTIHIYASLMVHGQELRFVLMVASDQQLSSTPIVKAVENTLLEINRRQSFHLNYTVREFEVSLLSGMKLVTSSDISNSM